MAKKKQQTYGSMARTVADMLAKMEEEKKRMSEVMATALLDDKAAAVLGDFSDADLRRVMVLLAAHVEDCAVQVQKEKQAAKEKKENAVSPAPVSKHLAAPPVRDPKQSAVQSAPTSQYTRPLP